jgi:hypothetical protein
VLLSFLPVENENTEERGSLLQVQIDPNYLERTLPFD